MEDLAPMIASLGFFAAVIWIVSTVVKGRRRKEELAVLTNLHNRLLDKIQSGPDLKEFMESVGGDRLLRSLEPKRGGGLERVLGAVQAGIVLTLLGLALLSLGSLYGFSDEGFKVLGMLVLALGVGFLLSSTVSYHLQRKLGVLSGS